MTKLNSLIRSKRGFSCRLLGFSVDNRVICESAVLLLVSEPSVPHFCFLLIGRSGTLSVTSGEMTEVDTLALLPITGVHVPSLSH